MMPSLRISVLTLPHLPKALSPLGVLTDKALAQTVAQAARVPFIAEDLAGQMDRSVLDQYDWQLMTLLECLPLKLENGRLKVAVADPLDRLTIRKLEFCTGMKLSLVVAPISDIHDCLASVVKNFRPEITPFEKFLAQHADVAGQVETVSGTGSSVSGLFDFDAARTDESEFVDMADITIGHDEPTAVQETIALEKIDGDDFQSLGNDVQFAPASDLAAHSDIAEIGVTDTADSAVLDELVSTPSTGTDTALAAAEESANDDGDLIGNDLVDIDLNAPESPQPEIAADVIAVNDVLEPEIASADAAQVSDAVSVEPAKVVQPVSPAQYSQVLAQLNLAALAVSSAGRRLDGPSSGES